MLIGGHAFEDGGDLLRGFDSAPATPPITLLAYAMLTGVAGSDA